MSLLTKRCYPQRLKPLLIWQHLRRVWKPRPFKARASAELRSAGPLRAAVATYFVARPWFTTMFGFSTTHGKAHAFKSQPGSESFRNLLGVVLILGAATQATMQCPLNTERKSHDSSSGMPHRSDMAMGFEQSQSTHHFLLTRDGGVIAVAANHANDDASRARIRMHLSHIAKKFAEGDFDIPMLVHNQTPPGVAVMKSRKQKIRYRFEEATNGGRVVITTTDAEAVSAIHDFLIFQIREHKTGAAVQE